MRIKTNFSEQLVAFLAVCVVIAVTATAWCFKPHGVSEKQLDEIDNRVAIMAVQVRQYEKRIDFMERMVESMKRKTIEVMVMPPDYVMGDGL